MILERFLNPLISVVASCFSVFLWLIPECKVGEPSQFHVVNFVCDCSHCQRDTKDELPLSATCVTLCRAHDMIYFHDMFATPKECQLMSGASVPQWFFTSRELSE